MTVMEMTRPEPVANGRLARLSVTSAAFGQHILAVEFHSPDGRHWNAIGGGTSAAAAIIDARQSCPNDATWDAVSWNDLYGC
jgi:hypothetical protein